MDNELGPATGDFRVWLDLAIARGYTVTWTNGVHYDTAQFSDYWPPEGDPIYNVRDEASGAQDPVWSIAGVQAFFRRVDKLNNAVNIISRYAYGWSDPNLMYGETK